MADETVGEFFVHLVPNKTIGNSGVATYGVPEKKRLVSSNDLFFKNGGKPSVIHFYDSGWGGCRPCAAQMEEWGKRYPDVQFLCICVETQRVAKQFETMFGFEHVVNGYIPSQQYLPRGYGQLGCSGFIVVDKYGKFVSRKTKPYLQYGEYAFRHVEAILDKIYDNKMATRIASNDVTQLIASSAGQGKMTKHVLTKVGVKSMDDEHEQCEDAINELVTTLSEDSIARVIFEFEEHFQHEEALMKQSEHFQVTNAGPMSALTSHVKDHERILDILRHEWDRLQVLKRRRACVASSSWRPGATECTDLRVDAEVAEEVKIAFYNHVIQFDSLYEGRIPSVSK